MQPRRRLESAEPGPGRGRRTWREGNGRSTGCESSTPGDRRQSDWHGGRAAPGSRSPGSPARPGSRRLCVTGSKQRRAGLERDRETRPRPALRVMLPYPRMSPGPSRLPAYAPALPPRLPAAISSRRRCWRVNRTEFARFLLLCSTAISDSEALNGIHP